MVAISIDKYIAIMYPMRLRMPKTKAKIVILVIWSAALITSLPIALLSSLDPFQTVTPVAGTSSTNLATSGTIINNQPATNNSNNNSYNDNDNINNNSLVYNRSSSSSWLSINNQSNNNSTLNSPIDIITNEIKSSAQSKESIESLKEKKQLLEEEEQEIAQLQEQRKFSCQESWTFWPRGKYYYSMALMILQFVVPLFVLVITYSRIVMVVWGQKMPGEEDNARDARMARSKRKVNINNQINDLSFHSLES